MLDSEIVAAIVAGDADGLAAAYDRYAAPLHAFCCSLLTDPADAADAVQDTFIIAGASLAGLRDRDCLKPWLYAVVRNECRRRLRALAPDGPDGVTGDMVDFGVDLENAELPEVLGSVMAGLSLSQREVVELSMHQDFSSDDLASTLGVSGSQADALAAAACREFENSLGALLVAREGRVSCAKLDDMLEGWGGQPGALLRKRLNLHIQHCRICSLRRDRELGPAMLLNVLPVMAIARSLREQVLGLVASGNPDAVAYRAGVVRRAGEFEESGFPVPVDPPVPVRASRRPALAVAAVAVLAAAGALGLELGAHHGHSPLPVIAASGRQILSPPRTALTAQTPARSASSPDSPISAAVVPSPLPSLALLVPTPSLGPTGTPTPSGPPTGPSGSPTPPSPSPSSTSPSPSPSSTSPSPSPSSTSPSPSPSSTSPSPSPSSTSPSPPPTSTSPLPTPTVSVTLGVMPSGSGSAVSN